ncbi:MAG TPA: serpin family protein [Longimicrobiales bacterium]|nr:serpin family protein [Longimicrobiales bacterium]
MPRSRWFIGVIALVTTAVSCDRVTGPGTGKAPQPLTRLPRALSAAEQRVVAGTNAFAFGLLRQTVRRDPSANVFISPLSAALALGLAMNGARGETLAQMRATLGFGDIPLADADASYGALVDLLLGLDPGVDVRVANSVWARQGFPFEASFLDVARNDFDAQTSVLDFDDPNAAPKINEWVESSTGGKIDRIVEAPIDRDVVMYLINAVYFRGSWRERFDPAQTRDAPFHAGGGRTSTVKLMHHSGEGSYFEAGRVRGVELAYGRGAYVMDVVLPPDGMQLTDFVASLDTATWQRWVGSLHAVHLDLALPRFRLSYETQMKPALVDLGMALAFTPFRADFTGISPLGDRLYISHVKQKTYANVDEEGTEAAAATSVEISFTSATPSVSFVVDRPFVVAIRERFSGTLLFLGAIQAPEDP